MSNSSTTQNNPATQAKTKAETKQEFRRGLRAIWSHLSSWRREINWLIILGIISAIANGSVPYVTGRFFDALIHLSQHQVLTNPWTGWPLWVLFLVLWLLVQVVANNVDWIRDRMRRRVDSGVQFKVQTDGFVHMLRLPLTYHKNTHTNGDLQKISMASWRISAIIGLMSNMAPQLLSVLIGITLAASINLSLAGILALGVITRVMIIVFGFISFD